MYYIGLDVHKRIISYCVRDGSGKLHSEGSIHATRFNFGHWLKTLPLVAHKIHTPYVLA